MTRFLFSTLCAALATLAIASATATRSIEISNKAGALVDVAFLQPPSSYTAHSYGTIHNDDTQTFHLPDVPTAMSLRATGCHGIFKYTLPTKSHIVVTVLKGCQIKTQ